MKQAIESIDRPGTKIMPEDRVSVLATCAPELKRVRFEIEAHVLWWENALRTLPADCDVANQMRELLKKARYVPNPPHWVEVR